MRVTLWWPDHRFLLKLAKPPPLNENNAWGNPLVFSLLLHSALFWTSVIWCARGGCVSRTGRFVEMEGKRQALVMTQPAPLPLCIVRLP